MQKPTHKYPGVNFALTDNVGVSDIDAHYPIGFPNYPLGESNVMPVKEVAMMILMDTLTDKPDWHRKVFVESVVQKWRKEASQQSEDGLYARIMQDKLDGGPPKPRSRIVTDAVFDYVSWRCFVYYLMWLNRAS
jgi:hypothetical protein